LYSPYFQFGCDLMTPLSTSSSVRLEASLAESHVFRTYTDNYVLLAVSFPLNRLVCTRNPTEFYCTLRHLVLKEDLIIEL
jgi:hypothetical protein